MINTINLNYRDFSLTTGNTDSKKLNEKNITDFHLAIRKLIRKYNKKLK